MAYVSPSGWIETLPREPESTGPDRTVFHTRQDCPKISDGAELEAVERPYSAKRCATCAAM